MASRSFIGFDSAWTDKPNAPGAICIIRLKRNSVSFVEPELASFDQSLHVIEAEKNTSDLCLVALDQPTIVPNLTSMRPVDRVAASLISWLGGGVQPANRSKKGMFDDAAPIWHFKQRLGAIEDPHETRRANKGLFLIETFPALALPSIEERFHARLMGPRYNPARKKTFRAADWLAVLEAVGGYARAFDLEAVAKWCEDQRFRQPRKADQDKLDSVICALAGYAWVVAPRTNCVMIGDLENGYMISPITQAVRTRLAIAGERYGVPLS